MTERLTAEELESIRYSFGAEEYDSDDLIRWVKKLLEEVAALTKECNALDFNVGEARYDMDREAERARVAEDARAKLWDQAYQAYRGFVCGAPIDEVSLMLSEALDKNKSDGRHRNPVSSSEQTAQDALARLREVGLQVLSTAPKPGITDPDLIQHVLKLHEESMQTLDAALVSAATYLRPK